MKLFSKLGLTIFLVIPGIAFAAPEATVGSMLALFTRIINALLPFILALAVLFFVWGVLMFVKSSGNEDDRTEGRNRMIYGIIGIFVMVSVWGLVNILTNTINLNDTFPEIPQFPIIG